MDADLLVALKALSDASRLRIVGVLAEGKPISVEDLAKKLSLARERSSITSTACARRGSLNRPHVGHTWTIRCVSSRLAEIGGDLSRMAHEQAGDSGPLGAPDWASAEEAKVLRSFFENGLLTSIPAQRSKRLVNPPSAGRHGLREEAPYPEKEVNQRLGALYPDRRRCAAIWSTRASWRARTANTDFDRGQIGHVPSASRKRLSARAPAPAPKPAERPPRRAPRRSRRALRRS